MNYLIFMKNKGAENGWVSQDAVEADNVLEASRKFKDYIRKANNIQLEFILVLLIAQGGLQVTTEAAIDVVNPEAGHA